MAAAGASQASSPRLPSPPPFTEVQIGPKSPSVGESFGQDAEQLLGTSHGADDGSTRRIRPGTKSVDMAVGPPLVPLSQLDSSFQLQEHLKALYNHYTRPEGSDTVVPINREVAIQLAEPPGGVDRSLWLYELCRFLTMKVNNLIIAFFAENPPCSAQTCPEMRASEWQYLCAVHDPPKSCCAIDYSCHTLDWATNILTSPKYFPSRLTLGSEAGGGPQASMRHLTNIFRRLYRIFAHAWFQHREVFWQVEGHDGLYIFFKTVCDLYSLIPEDNYTVPAEAEGADPVQPAEEQMDGRRMTILRKEGEGPLAATLQEPPSATTRRHKNTPSTSSRVTTIRDVTTISESAEDDEQQPKQQETEKSTEEAQKEPEPQPPVEAVSEETKTSNEQAPIGSTESQITVAEVQDDEETEAAPQAVDADTKKIEQEESNPSTEGSDAQMDEPETASTEEAPKSEPEAEIKQTTDQEAEPVSEPAKET
ncbi:Mob1/phocein [Aspergillus caelatus]|uniref:Mob1/phocein n=1 Tax=Aspergillus caelatus TaxID=61420 RepID=A0A5N7A028_9EURO|nr:Mob1/phocein [Aspergillus caelatus]KAE8363207.1 Mob1/phocein [Aspergillus caelatus]